MVSLSCLGNTASCGKWRKVILGKSVAELLVHDVVNHGEMSFESRWRDLSICT